MFMAVMFVVAEMSYSHERMHIYQRMLVSDMKIATLARGKVPPPRKKEFEDGYSSLKTSSLPQGLERSFLLRSTSESGTYIIETIWSSQEALDAMRSSGKPKAVALFEQVGVSPTVEIHEVAETVP